MLTQFIRFYGNAMQGMMGNYLERNVQAFIEMQKRMQEQSKQLYGDPTQVDQDLWSQFLSFQGPAMQSLMSRLHGAERSDVPADAGAAAEPDAQHVLRLPVPRRSAPPAPAQGRAPQPDATSRQPRAERLAPMTDCAAAKGAHRPRVGFVSLGCPKALVDSERILTQLRAEGYEIVARATTDADLVVVNTCGFIDAAVEESLDAIGEALAENGQVIVTGCLGAKGERSIRDAIPSVLAVTGPHALRRSDGGGACAPAASRTTRSSTSSRRRASS